MCFSFQQNKVGRGPSSLTLQIRGPLNQSNKFQQGCISKLPFMDQGELSGREMKRYDINDQSNKTHCSISHSVRQEVKGIGG